MNGVEVLNTIYEYGSMMSPMWLIFFTTVAIIIAILGIITVSYDNVQIILKILEIFAIVGIIVCGIGLVIKNDEIVDTKYQVIISDDVNFGEFMKKYEILNQEGEIYTVREKE